MRCGCSSEGAGGDVLSRGLVAGSLSEWRDTPRAQLTQSFTAMTTMSTANPRRSSSASTCVET